MLTDNSFSVICGAQIEKVMDDKLFIFGEMYVESTPSAPLEIALSKAGMVFSGAVSLSPRQAIMDGFACMDLLHSTE